MADPTFRAVSSTVIIPSQGNGSVGVTKPTGTVDGDYVFIVCVTGNDGSIANVAPAGFTSLQVVNNGSFNSGVRVFGKVASSEGASWSLTEGVSNAQGTAFAISYSNPGGTPINTSAQSGQQNSTTAPAFSTLTTTGTGKLIGIATEYNGRTATITAAGSMTSRIASSANGRSFGFFDEDIATTGSISGRTATSSVSGDFYAVSVLLAGPSTAPSITGPSGASVTTPSTANFTASVTGTYTGLRWQRQAAGAGAWADVSGGTGGTTTSYTTGATAVSGGSFNNTDKIRLAVDWSGGVVYSAEVVLTVIAAGTAPSFSVQPSNQSATVGGTASFGFTVSGSGSLTVQARKNGVDVGSPIAVTAGVSANYTTPALLIGDSGAVYSFVATGNTAPTATSSNATLTVLQPIATTFTFSFNGGNSLTGLKYAVFDQVTPDLWVAPVKKASNGSSNGSGLVTIDVTGLTARRIGELGSAFVTNSDGTATGGSQAATRKAAYYVGVFA